MDYLLLAVIVSLCGVVIFQMISHRLERSELLNRIMSRDFTEYSVQSNPNKMKPAHNHIQESIRRSSKDRAQLDE